MKSVTATEPYGQSPEQSQIIEAQLTNSTIRFYNTFESRLLTCFLGRRFGLRITPSRASVICGGNGLAVIVKAAAAEYGKDISFSLASMTQTPSKIQHCIDLGIGRGPEELDRIAMAAKETI